MVTQLRLPASGCYSTFGDHLVVLLLDESCRSDCWAALASGVNRLHKRRRLNSTTRKLQSRARASIRTASAAMTTVPRPVRGSRITVAVANGTA